MDQIYKLEAMLAAEEAEKAYLRAAFEEFVEVVDDALLLEEELTDAWIDLCEEVVKARKVLGTP